MDHSREFVGHRGTISRMTRPQTSEYAEYYSRYVDLVPDGDVVAILKSQLDETSALLDSIADEKSLHSYAPEKWTIKQLVNHINDTERVFTGRALWFGRGFSDPMPSFDQDIAVAGASANDMSWSALKEDFAVVRKSTISFFESLPEEGWSRSGVASDNSVTVKALAYIIAGHVAHHRNILKERYL